MHDAAAHGALCDLLEVTRRVMLPVSDGGTHWCAAETPRSMLQWTLSELAEVEDEIEAASAATPEVRAAVLTRVEDELGDLIFDVLMLACVCERGVDVGGGGHGSIQIANAFAGAAAKVKRRCPHVFGPLDGPAPSKAAEQLEWNAAKAREKAAKAGGGSLPPAPPTRDRGWWMEVDSFVVTAAAAAAGFVLGVAVARRG